MDWTGVYEIIQSLEEFKAVSMSPYDFGFEGSNNKHLTLTVHATQQPTVDLYVYSPYWLINKTDLVIQVKVREFGEDLLNYDQYHVSKKLCLKLAVVLLLYYFR